MKVPRSLQRSLTSRLLMLVKIFYLYSKISFKIKLSVGSVPAELIFPSTSRTVLHVSVTGRLSWQVEARCDGGLWVETFRLTVLCR